MTDAFEPTPETTTSTTGASRSQGSAMGAETLEQGRLQGRSPAVDGAVHRLESGRRWARLKAERAQDHVRSHPLRTTAYALGAGVLAGMVLRSINRGR